MAAQDYLYRGGERIALEKESEVFTTILPDAQSVQAVMQHEPVEMVKHVFENVYKVQTMEGARDVVMQDLRADERNLTVSHHAYHPVGDEATVYYLTDMLMVAFQPGVTNTTIEAILAQHGLKYIKTFEQGDPLVYMLQVTKSAGKNPIKVSEDLQQRPEVLFAEPNLVNRFQNFYTPTDTFFRNQWHLKSTNGIELSPDANVDAASAWDITRGSRGIVVAVIDDGFDLTHPDFNGLGKITFPRDFADGDDQPLPNRRTGDYHGTPCAGLAIGEENGMGIVGVAPGCTFMPVRFGLTADDKLLYEIFEYTGSYADVISCSWGPVPVFAPLSSLLSAQLTKLTRTGGPRGKGCVILFAAGNYNAPIRDMNNTSFIWRHPTNGLKETTGPLLNGHAAHPDVIAVSASTSQNRKAAYSNWGAEIDVAAPSDNIHPLDFQLRQPGQSIWTAYNENLGSRYTDSFGGTSAATPIAAGVAALILSANPELTGQQVKEVLQNTADKIIDENPDPVLSQRKGTYDANGHSDWFGFGKVNAFRAVRRALELKPAPVDDNGEPETPVIDPTPLTRGIHIAAAMINPKGSDRGKEQVSLLNITDKVVDLAGWEIRNKAGERERIPSLVINPGNNGVVTLTRINLPNLGGKIELFNPDGVKVEEVSYNFAEGLRTGAWIKF